MYASPDYYYNDFRGEYLGPENIEKALQTASDMIDTLTFNRIASLDGLTAFQRGIIQKVACQLAEWTEANKDALDSPWASYSINGVSMSLSTAGAVQRVSGVYVPRHLYQELCKTGLCYRGVMI